MVLEIFIRYLHFISLFVMASAMVAEHLLFKPQMTWQELQRMTTIDNVYGVSAITVVIAGLILWFGVGKAADFYSQNWIFLTKVGVFTIIGLLSIYPTIFFARNRKGKSLEELVEVPTTILFLIRLELALLLFIPLLATLMARGIGYFGD